MIETKVITVLNKITHRAAAKCCLFVFFMKMFIAAIPMFVNVLDKGTVLQVVLQLEIENSSKANNVCEDAHEGSCKFFNATSSDYFQFYPFEEHYGKQQHYLKNEKLIQAFHPAVPTPPPNV